MNTIRNVIGMTVLILLVSCNKQDVEELSFNAQAYNAAEQLCDSFNVGDTVYFRFTGNPDQITFYSGEIGSKYANKNRVSVVSGLDSLRFNSVLNTVGVSGNLQLLISTDSILNYTQINAVDSLTVPLADWKDISSKAVWATNATVQKSGTISLDSFALINRPIWLAFKYTAEAGVTQKKWTITGIDLRHTVDSITTTSILSTACVFPTSFPAVSVSPGWGTINVKNNLMNWAPNSPVGGGKGISKASSASTTSFVINGNSVATTAVATESWIVSGPIDLSRVLPDVGVSIKNMSENAMTIKKGFVPSLKGNYTYKFITAGTYTVVFEASNNNLNGQKSFAKAITLFVKNK